MDRPLNFWTDSLRALRRLDWKRLDGEAHDLSRHFFRQLFNQIPGVSGVMGLFMGTWVASTFTTSPWKAALARHGFMKGGTHVVSGFTYKLLSVGLPLITVAITAYLVSKALRWYRALQLEKDMRQVASMSPKIQAAVRERLEVLDRASALGLLSASEHETKKARLFAGYCADLPPEVRGFFESKLG